jgi:ribulose-phosphate 3-epimerase
MSFWESFPKQRLLTEVSLWSADFTCFGEEIRRVDPYADLYHFDVSDGHFVPGLLFFADLVSALRPLTVKPFHVHLMATQPLSHIDNFIEAGADLISVHAENGPLTPAALQAIRKKGAGAGLAIGLDTALEQVLPYLDLIDVVILMGTPMGIKGIEPSRYAFERIRHMQALIAAAGMVEQVKVEADGGIRHHTVPDLRLSGADLIVAGSLVFKAPDLEETFTWLHGLPTGASA